MATALEIYVKGSLKLFNHRTNVDINNRLVCYDVQLGNQTEKNRYADCSGCALCFLLISIEIWNKARQISNEI